MSTLSTTAARHDVIAPSHLGFEEKSLDYFSLEQTLFDDQTSVQQLQQICLLLEHTADQSAQDLLQRFRQHQRSMDIWQEKQSAEELFNYLAPQNGKEERDYLALKVMQELEDEVLELGIECEQGQLKLDKKAIEIEALQNLPHQGAVEDHLQAALQGEVAAIRQELQTLQQTIVVKEKVLAEIQQSITTTRYKSVDPTSMRYIHFF